MNTAPTSRDRRRALAPSHNRVPVEARLSADDGDGADRLRWVRLVGRAPFQYGKQVWNLDADRTDPRALQFRWADFAAALKAQPARFAPAVTVEHQRNGTGLGTVARIVELTAQEAKSRGITQLESHALYAGLRLTDPDARAAYDAGRVQYVSPAFLAALPTDQPDRVEPIWIDELSFVTVPHLRGQPNVADQLRSVQLRAYTMDAHEKIIAKLADKLAEVGVDPDKAKAVVDAMTESMGEEEYLEMQDEAAKMAADCASDDSELGKLKAAMEAQAEEINALRASLSATSASARVEIDTVGRVLDPVVKGTLAKLAASDEGAYKAMLSALPAARTSALPARSLPTARPMAAAPPKPTEIPMGAAFAQLSGEAQDEAIEALCAAKGVDYMTAASWCETGKPPAGMVGRLASGLTAFPTHIAN